MSAPNVNQGVKAREIIGSDDCGGDLGRHRDHRLIENGGGLGVLGKVLINGHRKGMSERGLAGLHAMQ